MQNGLPPSYAVRRGIGSVCLLHAISMSWGAHGSCVLEYGCALEDFPGAVAKAVFELDTWTLGRGIDWSYSKHPPLMGWVARAWTSVFPLTNWSFQLMALTNAAFALWTVDLISRRFVRGDKRMIVLLLLMLLPIYQFHAQRFNANSVLLATW